MNRLITSLLLISFASSTIIPMQAQQTGAPDDVVRISTKLVQIDAVVTDKSGNPIKDLTANDFEVFQDGKPQKIVSVSFVNTEVSAQPVNVQQPAASPKPDKNAPLAPPMRTTAANAGRILTFVVDDGSCTASRVGMLATQEAL